MPAYSKSFLQVIDKIIAAGKKEKKASSEHFKQFTRQFFVGATSEYFDNTPHAQLYSSAAETFEFMKQGLKDEPFRVRVYNPSGASERTFVHIFTRDVPFLIDSATAAIASEGCRIYEVLHPVLKVKRDGHGAIAALSEVMSGKADGAAESVIQFEISYIESEVQRERLEALLRNVLQSVVVATADWKPMLKKVQDTIGVLNDSLMPFTVDHMAEVQGFFKWLLDNHFTFLGYGRYEQGKAKDTFQLVKNERLGLFRLEPENAQLALEETSPRVVIKAEKKPSLIEFSKSGRPSLVHRPVHMDYIRLKQYDKKGKLIGEIRFLGLFTSSVYYQSATFIPIIRKKIDAVVQRAGFEPASHNGKELVTILETYPRDELFQISEDKLYEICMGILELQKSPRVKMFLRKDVFDRFVSCIIFIPRERFTTQLREQFQVILREEFGGNADDYYTQVTDSPLARLHVIVKTNAEKITPPHIAQAEKRMLEATNSWIDGLHEIMVKQLGERKGDGLFQKYIDAFPLTYKNRYHFGGTFHDILKIEEAMGKHQLTIDFYQRAHDKEHGFQLKLFHPESQLTLSNILPILENLGFHVVDEHTYLISTTKEHACWLHHFHLQVDMNGGKAVQQAGKAAMDAVKSKLEEALFQVWNKHMEDDVMNKLVLKAGMDWRDVVLLRAYSKYLKQAESYLGFDFIATALSHHPVAAQRLVKLFYDAFAPGLNMKEREKRLAAAETDIEAYLQHVQNVSEDRIIRQLHMLLSATWRTNFFQKDADGNAKNYVSFKFNSRRIPFLPNPKPFAEIFVYSCDVEGIHLRGGKVARGGLRWSDRAEDFRTEVLGLMKAQMVKNAVIVPVGSKGGFVVKRKVKGTRDEVLAQGIACYKTFLRGLLDITDNYVKTKIVRPADVVCHDEEDPYLVVAADKGTASFSDIANGVAAEYGFWLGDAFASGGSQGYDHKGMGITARGGWVSVQRHFAEMGVDVQKDPFTVLGIGDMSGDVFGNGMLLSRTIKLVGAFNHMHIFIDPNPDMEASFKERERLFALPRSSWKDYNEKLISEGGGIFERDAKLIKLTPQIRALFDIEEAALAPDMLIKAMLKSRVDLLWNGGIGTYVKALSENHNDVGDHSNNALRVNGRELRCKVVGEGGNLGFTQLGRVEFATRGGRINTDFIDNSAGVDCSDHEVNMKIALNMAVEKKSLSEEKRNSLLVQMTDEVASLVLRDNQLQTQAISIAEQQGHGLLEAQMRLMKYLEQRNLLDRKIEFLPDDETIMQQHAAKQKLTRPELSVLLSYSKIALYNDLIESNLPDDAYFLNDLTLYFPTKMRKQFAGEIRTHRLRREIVATAVSNSIVNRVGSEFLHHIQQDTGVKACDIARAYTISRDAFNVRDLWLKIEDLDGKVPVEIQVDMFLVIKQLIERSTLWLLRNHAHPLKVADLIAQYAPGIAELHRIIDNIMSPVLKETVQQKRDAYIAAGAPKAMADRIAQLIALASALDIVNVSRGSKYPVKIVGEIYFSLGTRLNLGWLRKWTQQIPKENYWQHLSAQTLTDALFDEQRRLAAEVTRVMCKDDVCSTGLQNWEAENAKELQRYDLFISDLKANDKVDMNMLVVAARRVESLSKR